MPEIVRHGENGFLVASIDEAVAAVRESEALDGFAVRRSVEQRFDSGRMVEDYLAVYRQVVDQHRRRRAGERSVD
jgi:glycosyltransferase involved in cell wall biosynthesis